MNEFLNFDKMITPTIIKIIFWIGVVVCVIGGLVTIIQGASSPFGGGVAVLMGLVIMLLGPLFVRIYCEILIIFFKMNDNLNEIKKILNLVNHYYLPAVRALSLSASFLRILRCFSL